MAKKGDLRYGKRKRYNQKPVKWYRFICPECMNHDNVSDRNNATEIRCRYCGQRFDFLMMLRLACPIHGLCPLPRRGADDEWLGPECGWR